MKRIWLIIIILLLAVLLFIFGAALGEGTGAQQEFGEQPTVVPADALTPVPTPRDDRQVAVLTLLVVSTEEGKVEGVKLIEAKTLNSFAPNVFGLSGAWTVELGGQRTLRYGVPDPRLVHVEEESEKEEGAPPHSTFFETEVEWRLVVPLYDEEENLSVQTISIYDQDGNLVFAVEVEGWRTR